MLWGAVAIHQSVGLGDLVGSVELLRGKGRLLLLSRHGVDGRTHGLGMVAVGNGGGAAPTLGRLCSRGQRTRRRSICSVRHAAGARALARTRLGLRRASSDTGSVHGVIGDL